MSKTLNVGIKRGSICNGRFIDYRRYLYVFIKYFMGGQSDGRECDSRTNSYGNWLVADVLGVILWRPFPICTIYRRYGGEMKLKHQVAFIRAVLRNKTLMDDVDPTRAMAVVDEICSDMPEIKADTVDEADALAKRVMDWLKELSSKKVRPELSYRERLIVVGALLDRIDSMHLQLEQLLYDMGVVERGQTDTQETDSA